MGLLGGVCSPPYEILSSVYDEVQVRKSAMTLSDSVEGYRDEPHGVWVIIMCGFT